MAAKDVRFGEDAMPMTAEAPSAWSLVFDGYDPPREGIREALCTLGNG